MRSATFSACMLGVMSFWLGCSKEKPSDRVEVPTHRTPDSRASSEPPATRPDLGSSGPVASVEVSSNSDEAVDTSSSSGAGPVGRAAVGGASVSGGTIANASTIVAGLTTGLKRCYQRGLSEEDPKMIGSLRVEAVVGPNGEVKSAKTSGGNTLSDTVKSCVAKRVNAVQFDKPSTGAATVIIPISFYLQK